MTEIIEWIKANWAYIGSALFGIVFVSTVIVKLTPSTKDDSFMRKVIDALKHFSTAYTADEKKLLDMSEKVINEVKE